MPAPRWAVGMQRIGPGIYVDGSHNLHVCDAELLERLGWPATPENVELAERLAMDAVRKLWPEAATEVVHVPPED